MKNKRIKHNNGAINEENKGNLILEQELKDSIDSENLEYKAKSTDIITPGDKIESLEEKGRFRILRYHKMSVKKRSVLTLLTDRQAEIKLKLLKIMYADWKENSEEKEPKLTSLSKVEEALIRAAEFILSGELNFSYISSRVGISHQRVSSLFKRICGNGEILPQTSKSQQKLSPFHIEFLDKILKESDGWKLTLKDMRNQLLKNFPELQKLSITSIHSRIIRLGYSHKKVKTIKENSNDPERKVVRKHVSKNIIELLINDAEIIFVDEWAYNFCLVPRAGWSKKGQNIYTQQKAQSINYTVICAINKDNFLGFQVLLGGLHKEDYGGFLNKLISRCELNKINKSIVIFHDGASSHRSSYVKNNLDEKILIICNAPLTPQLNAIEYVFSKIKSQVILDAPNNENELIHSIHHATTLVTLDDIHGYVRRMLYFVEKGIRKEDFF